MEKYQTFSTTADVGIRIHGINWADLYHSALKGTNLLFFGESTVDDIVSSSIPEMYPFEFLGDNCENVLVNFLSEITYLLQEEGKYTKDFNIVEARQKSLKAELIIYPCRKTPLLEIKSVTYHNLKVVDGKNGKYTEVIFDV